jgi:hypothetical protein
MDYTALSPRRQNSTYILTFTRKYGYWYEAGWQCSNTPETYSGEAQSESQLGHQLPWLRFSVVFLSPSRKILE